MLSHGNLIANAQHFLYTDALAPEDRYLHAGPMFHVADSTMVHCLTWAGGAHVLLDRFDLPALVRAVEHDGVTVLVLVPTMIRMLLDHLDEHPADLSGLRLLHYAAAPITPDLLQRAMRTLPCDFVHGYGMTEAAPGVTYLSPQAHRAATHLGSVGHAIPGVQVEIRDAVDGSRRGLRPRPERDARLLESRRRPRSADGWYRTGDVGYLDDGHLYLVDRLKDMIISGGENVYSIEVENVIASCPGVQRGRRDRQARRALGRARARGHRGRRQRRDRARALPDATRRLQAPA